jgi:hypothetical protein
VYVTYFNNQIQNKTITRNIKFSPFRSSPVFRCQVFESMNGWSFQKHHYVCAYILHHFVCLIWTLTVKLCCVEKQVEIRLPCFIYTYFTSNRALSPLQFLCTVFSHFFLCFKVVCLIQANKSVNTNEVKTSSKSCMSFVHSRVFALTFFLLKGYKNILFRCGSTIIEVRKKSLLQELVFFSLPQIWLHISLKSIIRISFSCTSIKITHLCCGCLNTNLYYVSCCIFIVLQINAYFYELFIA